MIDNSNPEDMDIPSSSEEEIFIFKILTKMGCSSTEAIAYSKIMFKTISEPILERVDASIELVATELKTFAQLLEARDEKMEARDVKMEAQRESLEAKIDAQRESLEAKIDAQNTKYNLLIWIAGVIGGTGIFNLLAQMFGWFLGGG